MKNNKNIIDLLISQHNLLKNELALVSSSLEELTEDSYGEIDKQLRNFSTSLSTHLTLENKTFYPDLLEKMKINNSETVNTEVFIDEMNKIGITVQQFLEKFKDLDTIKEKIEDFKRELPVIVETLALRIESEEFGVYDYWRSMSEK